MHLNKQPYKIRVQKTNLNAINSSNNAISSFKQAKCCKLSPLENFNKLHFHLPAS